MSRAMGLRHIKDGRKLRRMLQVPYLELPLPKAAAATMVSEALSMSARFVPHLGDAHPGWKAVCLHGLSAEQVLTAESYGYADEVDPDYKWTEIAEQTPAIKKYLDQLLTDRIFDEFHRVRLMWLEPGATIENYRERPDQDFYLGAVFIPLNTPAKWQFERWGEIPLNSGQALTLDNSFALSMRNLGTEPELVLCMHGAYGPGYFDGIAASAQELIRRSENEDGRKRLLEYRRSLPVRAKTFIWNYWPDATLGLFEACRALTERQVDLAGHRVAAQHTSLNALLQSVVDADWAVVLRPGVLLAADFYPQLEAFLRDDDDQTWIYARSTSARGFANDFFILNLRKWTQLGSPRFAMGGEEHQLFGWNAVEKAERKEFKTRELPGSLAGLLRFLNPQDNGATLLRNLNRRSMEEPLSADQRDALTLLFQSDGNSLLYSREYWKIEMQKDKRPLNALWTHAVGFRDLFAIHQFGVADGFVWTLFDSSKPRLAFKKWLYENWDGRGLPRFLRVNDEPVPEGFDEAWQNELTLWGGADAFSAAFTKAKALKREFVQMDINADAGAILSGIENANGESCVLLLNDSFTSLETLQRDGWSARAARDRSALLMNRLFHLSSRLKRSVTVYGEDHSPTGLALGDKAADLFG